MLYGFCQVAVSDRYFPEEERSRQPSIFTVIRAIVNQFYRYDLLLTWSALRPLPSPLAEA